MNEKNSRSVILRLSLLMVFLFMPLSCWWLTLATYIEQNTGTGRIFLPGFVGLAYSTSAIGSMISPLLWGSIADRAFSAQKIMAGLQLICAGLVSYLSMVTSQQALWWTLLAYAFCFSPMMGLANSVCFRHLRDPEKMYPLIRTLGTVSWVLGGWLVGYLAPVWFGESIEATTWPMRIAAVVHLVAAGICLMAPATPPLPGGRRRPMIGWDAFQTLFSSTLCFPVIALTLLAVSLQFYNVFANVFLNHQGVVGAVGHLSWGQVTEIGIMLLLPIGIATLGMKWTLFTGAICWPLRYLLLAYSTLPGWQWLYWPAILLHGLGFTYCYVALQIFAERRTAPESRAAVQGLISVLTMGVGAFVGSHLTSYCQIRFLSAGAEYDWRGVWMTAATVAIIPTIMLLFIRDKKSPTLIKGPNKKHIADLKKVALVES